MSDLIEDYDRKLEILMSVEGFERLVPGLYTSSIDGVIWKGLAVSFQARLGELSILPALGVYCPAAYRIIKSVFRKMGNKGFETGAMSQRVGVPFLIKPLNYALNDLHGDQRSSVDYNINSIIEVDDSVRILIRDFLFAGMGFFSRIIDVTHLLEFVISEQSHKHPSASINAMALSLKIDPNISLDRLDSLRSLYPSTLTDRFYQFLVLELKSKR